MPPQIMKAEALHEIAILAVRLAIAFDEDPRPDRGWANVVFDQHGCRVIWGGIHWPPSSWTNRRTRPWCRRSCGTRRWTWRFTTAIARRKPSAQRWKIMRNAL